MAQTIRRGDRVRIRGQQWTVTSCTGPLVHVRSCEPEQQQVHAAFLMDVEQLQRIPPRGVAVVKPSRWRQAVRGMLSSAAPSPASLLAATDASFELLPFQLEPALAWTSGVGVRLLIADEVGLGKTVQAGLIAAELLRRWRDGRVLVVTPAGLREQWAGELRDRFGLDVALVDSASLSRSSSATLTGANPWTASAVSIASIDFVKRPEVVRSIEPVVWDLVIFDEAHALSPRTDRAIAATQLASRARVLVLLSATPHNGDAQAFDHLTTLGDPAARSPLLVFRRSRRDAGFGGTRRTTWLRVRPTAAERVMHGALAAYTRAVWRTRGRVDASARLAAIVLTKRACSSAAALARSLERRLRLLGGRGAADVDALSQLPLPFAEDAAPDAEALAAPGLDDPRKERQWLQRLLDLARLAATRESKLEALGRLLRRADEPAIVFTEYRDTLAQLAARFAHRQPVDLHGGQTASERREVLRRFTTGGASLLLATDAASEGLNLQQRCRVVINLELPWSPQRLEQRIGRVERLGQTRHVHAIHFVARDTAEQRTVLRLMTRIARVDSALEALRRPAVSEADLGAAVVGGQPLDVHAGDTRLEGVIVPALREKAAAEAIRIASTRVLRGTGANDPDRPVVTRLRRRSGFAGLCAYRLLIRDADDELLWEWLVGLTAQRMPDEAHDLRQRLAATTTAFAAPVTAAHRLSVQRFTEHERAFVQRAQAREDAIAEHLRSQRARLARELVQRGLFDRRLEQAGAARDRVLEDALRQCAHRRRALDGRQHPTASGIDLAFAAFAG